MKISDIISADGEKKGVNGESCFEIISKHGNCPWEICTHIPHVRNMWFCKIQELRKETLPQYYQDTISDDN
jgi:hypothetical protein